MALQSADSKENVLEPHAANLSIASSDGKPCIDFQPDDRWQIKEEDALNSKSKELCSNGRKSQRLLNNKSSDSPMTNGEQSESCSDEETAKKTNENIIENVNTLETRSKRKRSLTCDVNAIQNSDKITFKKPKGNDEMETTNSIKTECCESEDGSNSTCKEKKVQDNESSKVNGSNLNSTASNVEKKSTSEDLSKDLPAAQNGLIKNGKVDGGKNNTESSSSKADDIEIIDYGASRNNTSCEDIEIINIPDDDKKSQSGEESDSEIQVISLEDNKGEAKEVADFPAPCSSDVTLTSGYPYYNSLKEKLPKFKAGEYKPVKFPHTGTLLLAENEVIIESPSLLVPLLIKESDQFPQLEGEEKKNSDNPVVAKPMMSRKNFFQSSVGQFLFNLGKSRVEEWYHRDMKHTKLKQLKRKKPTEEDLGKAIEMHDKRHNALKEINAVFNSRMRQCKFCEFKSESQIVLEGHYLTPHISMRREFKCNFCSFTARDSEQIVFHFEAMHGKKAILQANIFFHECIFCSFQSHLKTKVNAHMNRCRKHFIPTQNLAPPFDFEFPGVTTKPVTISDVVGHRRMLLNSAKNRLPNMSEDNSSNSAFARKKLASVLSKLAAPNAFVDIKNPSLMKQLMNPQTHMSSMSGNRIQLPPGIVITRPNSSTMPPIRPIGGRFPPPRGIPVRGPQPRRGPPFAPNLTSTASHLASAGISITPVRNGVPSRTSIVSSVKNVTLTPISAAAHRPVSQKSGPPQPVALYTNMAGSSILNHGQPRVPMNVTVRPLRPAAPYQRLNTPPSQVVKGTSGNTFVVCEICDSYIKDLEELRTHMNWVHKVKIHPKMLVSRPPLNCQKCQWRFFTDQGLERHLLGAHGLVTTNMQEMANKNQDGGRCIICGAVFTYKLVSHMTQVHKVTLKPAHLSYKCTVCTATFTLYRLFESHVYNVHSGSAKRPAEDSTEPPAKKVAENNGPRKCKDCGVVTDSMHDHIIKTHIKDCAVKLCRINKCEKCLYSSDEMLVIRMSDFGLEDEDTDDSGDDSSEDSSDKEKSETG